MGIEEAHLETAQDFTTAPLLRETAAEIEHWVAPYAARLHEGLPIPESVAAFAAPPQYRPPASNRSFYYLGPAGRAVVAFKGLEPTAGDFDELIRLMQWPSRSPHRAAAHLVLEEHKIPAAVSLDEALEEANLALAIQTAHHRAYGCLARLPLPLCVFRHSEATARTVAAKLEPLLSERAFRQVEALIAPGLGVYIYYYPTLPTRARDVDVLVGGSGFRRRTLALLDLCDPDAAVRRWAEGFARILHLGYLPGTLDSFRSGVCCQPQNACIDGGFVDIGSLTPLSALPDDTAVEAALQFCLDSLLESVRSLVTGTTDPARPPDRDVRVDEHHVRSFLLARVADALITESRPGLVLDRRLSRYFAPISTYADLVERLGPYYARPPSRAASASAGVARFGLSLIAAARDQEPDGQRALLDLAADDAHSEG